MYGNVMYGRSQFPDLRGMRRGKPQNVYKYKKVPLWQGPNSLSTKSPGACTQNKTGAVLVPEVEPFPIQLIQHWGGPFFGYGRGTKIIDPRGTKIMAPLLQYYFE